MKYIGLRTDTIKNLMNTSEKYLSVKLPGRLLARKWKGYWSSINGLEAVGEKALFDEWIDKSASRCWEMAMCLSSMEIALSAGQLSKSFVETRIQYRQALEKLFSYHSDMASTGLAEPVLTSRLKSRFNDIKDSDTFLFDYSKAYSYAISQIERLIPSTDLLIEQMEPLISDFGKLYDRHNYTYMLYYDIIDSTGTVAGREGKDLEFYRAQVESFKYLVNNQFHSLGITARKNRSEIYCYNGNKSSLNDCKHVFVSGQFAGRYLTDIATMLLLSCKSCSPVRIRIYAIPCNFAGTTAYRREDDPEIMGARFWEHWSRTLKATSSLEDSCGESSSFLLLASDVLITRFKLPVAVKWIETKETTVVSEIELLSRSTKVKYGAVRI